MSEVTQYAVVSKFPHVETDGYGSNTNNEMGQSELLARVYSEYSELFPNPNLQQEIQQADQLLRAVSAASHAEDLNPPPARNGGLLRRLFGGRGEVVEQSKPRKFQHNDNLLYTDIDETLNDHLLGTEASLDVSCIPPEAHAWARLSVVSHSSRRPNVAANSWKTTSTVVITGLGELVEFVDGQSKVMYTSDREALISHQQVTERNYDVMHARSTLVGPNFLMVSWGFLDGIVVFYRRTTDNLWYSMGYQSPSSLAVEALGDGVFDETSVLFRVAEVRSCVWEVSSDPIPACTIAIARLGGTIELLPLPSRLWFGRALDSSMAPKRRSKQRYCASLTDLTRVTKVPISVLKTFDHEDACYHTDIMGMQVIESSVNEEKQWDREKYPAIPPSQHVIAVYGNKDGKETTTFWSVSTIFESSEEFYVRVSLVEAICIGSVGPPLTVFATPVMMKHWRKPRNVQLKSKNDSYDTSQSRVTTLSVPPPLVSLECCFSNFSCFAGVRDAQGGITILDCTLLERTAAQSLNVSEFAQVYNEETVVPLVKTVADRSQVLRHLSSSTATIPSISAYAWCPDTFGRNPTLAMVSCGCLSLFSTEKLVSCRSVSISMVGLGSLVTSNNLLHWSPFNERSASLCSVGRLDPRHVVQTLYDEGKHEEALDAAQRASSTDRAALSNVLTDCCTLLWRKTMNLKFLEQANSATQIVQEAATFSEYALPSTELSIYRDLHELALSRVPSMRLGESLQLGGLEETKAFLEQRLLLHGTYILLSEWLSCEASIEVFLRDFVSTGVSVLASCFAEQGDVEALTIVWYRHFPEIFGDCFSILNELPKVLPPERYVHLLPVQGNRFLRVEGKVCSVVDWEQLPLSTDIKLACDEKDLAMVVATRVRFEDSLSQDKSASWKKGLAEWSLKRAQFLDRFVANSNFAINFCNYATLIDKNEPGCAQELQKCARKAEALRMPVEVSASLQAMPIPAAAISISEFVTVPVDMLLQRALAGVKQPIQLQHTFELLCSVLDSNPLEDGVGSYIRSTLSRSQTFADLRKAAEIVAAVANLSSSDRNRTTRLLKVCDVLVDLTITLYQRTIELASQIKVCNPDMHAVIHSIWRAYEALPHTIAESSLNGQMDILYRELVAADILSQWPDCQWQSILANNSCLLGEANKAVPEASVRDLIHTMCDSFMSQTMSASPSERQVRLGLLTDLLSDINELRRHSFPDSHELKRTVSNSLVLMLLSHRDVQLVEHFFSLSGDLVDNAMATKTVIAYIEGAIFGDEDAEEADFAMECRPLIGSVLVSFEKEFEPLQRLIDAAEFANSLLKPSDRLSAKKIQSLGSIDTLTTIIDKSPSSIIRNMTVWESEEQSVNANAALRDYYSRNRQLYGDLKPDPPQLPGADIFHLANILGFTGARAAVVVKNVLIKGCVNAGYYGASAALCRSLFYDNIDSLNEKTGGIFLDSVATVVLCAHFEDVATKGEVSKLGCAFFEEHTSPETQQLFSDIVKFSGSPLLTEWTYRVQVTIPSAMALLLSDTRDEYGTDLSCMFGTLSNQANTATVDGSLVKSLARFVWFWCIARATRIVSRNHTFETLDDSAVQAFAAFLFLHFTCFADASRSVEEIKSILEEQKAGVLNASNLTPKSAYVDRSIVDQLVARGYSVQGSKRAAMSTANESANAAIQWAVTHSLDADFDTPLALVRPTMEVAHQLRAIKTLHGSLNRLASVFSDGHFRKLTDLMKDTSVIDPFVQSPSSLLRSDEADTDLSINILPSPPKHHTPKPKVIIGQGKNPAVRDADAYESSYLAQKQSSKVTVKLSLPKPETKQKLLTPRKEATKKKQMQSAAPTVTVDARNTNHNTRQEKEKPAVPTPTVAAPVKLQAKTPSSRSQPPEEILSKELAAVGQHNIAASTLRVSLPNKSSTTTATRPRRKPSGLIVPNTGDGVTGRENISTDFPDTKRSGLRVPNPEKTPSKNRKSMISSPVTASLKKSGLLVPKVKDKVTSEQLSHDPSSTTTASSKPKIESLVSSKVSSNSGVIERGVITNGTPRSTSTLTVDTAAALSAGIDNRIVQDPSSSNTRRPVAVTHQNSTRSAPNSGGSVNARSLRDQGKLLLQSARVSTTLPTPKATSPEERRRLIEEGRRLFQRARGSNCSPTDDQAGSVVVAGTRSAPPSIGNVNPPSANLPSPVLQTPQPTNEDESSGWDFDDF